MFARKQKKPITQAIALIDEALAIADSYRRDNTYTPDNKDIEELDALLAALWANHCTLENIVRSLRGRAPEWERSTALARHFPELG